MPIPELIEIIPPVPPGRVELTVPGSKSITNRALVLAALATGQTVLKGALWSEDTEIMVSALRALGFSIDVRLDADEPGNRTITVVGQGGRIPKGGAQNQPLEIHVGNAGTAARFLAALVCLGQGFYRLSGIPRMHERPQRALFAALRQLGYEIQSANDKLPVIIKGAGARPGRCRVSIDESSQFASALLLCSRLSGWEIELSGQNLEEAPYVRMTERMVADFPSGGGVFQVEPDASSGSYFWGAGYLLSRKGRAKPGDTVTVRNWPDSGLQVDSRFPLYAGGDLPKGPSEASAAGATPRTISREHDLGDSIMTAVVLAPFWNTPTRFTDLGRLRLQECERVAALRTELTKCGARVAEAGDTLTVHPSELHGAEIETFDDHRMAMCFAMLGLVVPGIRLRNPGCVKKTFPSFFAKLASPPPDGLGVEIRDASTGQILSVDELTPG